MSLFLCGRVFTPAYCDRSIVERLSCRLSGRAQDAPLAGLRSASIVCIGLRSSALLNPLNHAVYRHARLCLWMFRREVQLLLFFESTQEPLANATGNDRFPAVLHFLVG